ncbi:MAG: hypothetical protein EOO14_20385, partial [Chitinophagaceae bacterium]
GRLWTGHMPVTGTLVEQGAEFIHGKKATTSFRLLKEAGIRYTPVSGEMYRNENGKLLPVIDPIAGWDKLLEKMGALETDMTLDNFLQEHFEGAQHHKLRRHARNYAGGFDLADPKDASVKALYREWSADEELNFRIDGGYRSIINHLEKSCVEKGCRILKETPVRQVDWLEGDVTVYSLAGEKFFAGKLIVTVPAAILARADDALSINFTPPLREQVEAAGQIGSGKVVKALLEFKKPCWPADAGFLFSNEIFATWWTQSPGTSALLTGWAGGPRALQLKDLDKGQLLEAALLSLSQILMLPLQQLKDNLKDAVIVDWQAAYPGLYGYSYSTLESKAARCLLNSPVKDSVYFCGEALYDGKAPGTVEAALVTATRLATILKES